MIVAFGVCELAGSSSLDLRNVYCCTVYFICKHWLYFICAVNLCALIRLQLSTFPTEYCSPQPQSYGDSSKNVTSGCGGATDGLLVVIGFISLKERNNNKSSYFSGNYCCYGFKFEGICLVICWLHFFLFSLLEISLIRQTLSAQDCQPPWIAYHIALLFWWCSIYFLSEICNTASTGAQKLNPTWDENDNFWVKFRFKLKWQMLLLVSLHVDSELVECFSRHHNYCIDIRSNDSCEYDGMTANDGNRAGV